MLAHARAELPNEACGILAGMTPSGRAVAYHPARNVHASPRRFLVDPEDQVRITYQIERAGQDAIAIFHSHPRTAAEPSASDRRAAGLHPDAIQLVASMLDPNLAGLRAWRVRDGRAEPVPVRLT
jgi:proteasome lid subunit RPN8/RPN11